MFVRRDPFKRFVTVLVTVPRDRFNAALRKALQDLSPDDFERLVYWLALRSGDFDQVQCYGGARAPRARLRGLLPAQEG